MQVVDFRPAEEEGEVDVPVSLCAGTEDNKGVHALTDFEEERRGECGAKGCQDFCVEDCTWGAGGR